MSRFQPAYGASSSTRTGVDEGLKAYMRRVYDLMFVGLGISALSAYGILQVATTSVQTEGAKAFTKSLWLTPAGEVLFSGWTVLIAFAASIALIFGIAGAIRRSTFGFALFLYSVFTAVFGLSLAMIVARYTSASVVFALSASAAMFGSLSLWGYVTRRDLSGWGTFLFMGLIGLIVVGIANMFIASTVINTVTAGVGVLIFAGFTAYDTQKIKEAYIGSMGREDLNKLALWGALDLYLDFVNLFVHLLQLFGAKDD